MNMRTTSIGIYRKFPVTVAHHIGPLAAVYLSELLNVDGYWWDNADRFQEKRGHAYAGQFFHSREKIQEHTGLSPAQQRTAQRQLIKAGLLTVIKRGLPARNFFVIDYRALNGLQNFIPERDKMKRDAEDEDADTAIIASGGADSERQEVANVHDQSCSFLTTGDAETERQDVQKVHGNKIKPPRSKNKIKVSMRGNAAGAANSRKIPESPSGAVQKAYRSAYESPHHAFKMTDSVSPPPPPDNLTSFERARHAYYRALEVRMPPHASAKVREAEDAIVEVADLFTPRILNYIWKNEIDAGTQAKVSTPLLPAFVAFGLLAHLTQHQLRYREWINQEFDKQITKLFQRYYSVLKEPADQRGYLLENVGQLEPKIAGQFFPKTEEYRVQLDLLTEHVVHRMSDDEKANSPELMVRLRNLYTWEAA